MYIPGEVLEDAGFGLDAPPPFYRIWAGHRRNVMVQLYEKGDDA